MSTNFDTWIETLRTTDLPQVRGMLQGESEAPVRAVSDTPPTGYCCLGLACTLLPDRAEVLQRSKEHNTVLAPTEAIEWLGLRERVDNRAWEQAKERPSIGFDIQLDFPEGPDWVMPTDDDYDEGQPYEEISAAALNDDGFTFSQIADLFAYFGVKGVS